MGLGFGVFGFRVQGLLLSRVLGFVDFSLVCWGLRLQSRLGSRGVVVHLQSPRWGAQFFDLLCCLFWKLCSKGSCTDPEYGPLKNVRGHIKGSYSYP